MYVSITFLLFSTKQHIDGAGKVDGSVVVALPVDEWTAPYEENAFLGGGLTFWDGPKTTVTSCPTPANANDNDASATSRMTNEIHYDTRSGDIAFIDRYVVIAIVFVLHVPHCLLQC